MGASSVIPTFLLKSFSRIVYCYFHLKAVLSVTAVYFYRLNELLIIILSFRMPITNVANNVCIKSKVVDVILKGKEQGKQTTHVSGLQAARPCPIKVCLSGKPTKRAHECSEYKYIYPMHFYERLLHV